MTFGMSIPTNAEYWGNATTDTEALRAAEALRAVLMEAADRLGVDAEIGLSDHGDTPDEDICETDEERALLRLDDEIWSHDLIQAAAYNENPVDAAAVLRDYNKQLRSMGGTGYKQFD